MSFITPLLMVVAAYFIGNLDFAYIVVKLVKKEDIRNYGSGNAGTTNVLRTMGRNYAILVFILDALKGSVVMLLARAIGFHGTWVEALAGAAVVCGHNWPALLGFKGGKGTATSIGVFMVYDPFVAVICIAFGLILLAIFKMMSLTSIAGMVSLPVVILLVHRLSLPPELALGIFLALSTTFSHKDNIKRIIAGTERKVGQKERI